MGFLMRYMVFMCLTLLAPLCPRRWWGKYGRLLTAAYFSVSVLIFTL